MEEGREREGREEGREREGNCTREIWATFLDVAWVQNNNYARIGKSLSLILVLLIA